MSERIMSFCCLLVFLALVAYIWLDAERSENYVLDNGFLTCTLAPAYVRRLQDEAVDDDYFSCAGLGHVRMCLANLMIVAKASGRRAILPPPWLYLHRDHNGGRELSKDVWWDRYFDLQAFVEAGHLARERMDVHEQSPIRGRVPKSVYVDPGTDPTELRRMRAKIVTLKFYEGWGGKGHAWECGCQEVGGGIGHGWQREVAGYPFLPSKQVKDAARSIVRQIAQPFVIVHVRRGDITRGGKYWELDTNDVDRITSGTYIRDFLRRHLGKTKLAVLIMSNEKDTRRFDPVREAFPNLWLEKDLKELRKIQEQTNDNFLAYEVCRFLGSLAEIRIATSPCYFYGGACDLRLVDGIKG